LETPNAKRINMNNRSEFMIGEEGMGDDDGRWTLHSKNKTMNRVRDSDRVRSFLADHIHSFGMEQRDLPMKSPRPNIKKCTEVNKRG
jgi:hypothetical protein